MEVLFFGAALVILVLAGVLKISADKYKEDCETHLADIPNFTASVSHIGGPGETSIAIDPKSRVLAMLIDKQQLILLPFSQIIAVEVVKNGTNITQSNRGSQVAGAAVGAMLLGPVGLILGGVTGSKTTKEKISHLSLKVRTTDMIQPVRDIVFYKSFPEQVDSPAMRRKLKEMDEWHSRILAIINSKAPIPV